MSPGVWDPVTNHEREGLGKIIRSGPTKMGLERLQILVESVYPCPRVLLPETRERPQRSSGALGETAVQEAI